MKAIRRLIPLLTVLALLLSMASCSLLEKKANFTQKITAGNIEATIRDDMKEDPSMKDKGYLTCYFWGGYGMNIVSVKSSESKWAGQTAESFLAEMLEDQKDVTGVKKLGDYSYIEYTLKQDDDNYLFSDFILEEGYEYYIIEFYTMSKSSSKYMEQYKSILSSVKIVEEPAQSVEATIEGVRLTLDGDAYDYGNSIYLCSRYLVNAFYYSVAGFNIDSKGYCQSLIEQNNYKDAEGQPVTVINTTEDGISSFECKDNDNYIYYYIKIVNKKAIGAFFATVAPADEQLKADFAQIMADADIA